MEIQLDNEPQTELRAVTAETLVIWSNFGFIKKYFSKEKILKWIILNQIP